MQKRVFSTLLAILMLLSLLPASAFAVENEDPAKVADDATLAGYESILGTDEDGARYAGRVWSDKSVFTKDSLPTTLDKITLASGVTPSDSSLPSLAPITLENNEFLTVFSALGSSRTISTMESTPIDLVLVLDVSSSMANSTENNGEGSRIAQAVNAANDLIGQLMERNENSRVGIVTFSNEATELVSLSSIQANDDSDFLTISSYSATTDNNNKTTGSFTINVSNSNGASVNSGAATFTQLGIYKGMEMLAKENVEDNDDSRIPVVVLLTDGIPIWHAEYTSDNRDQWWVLDGISTSRGINDSSNGRAARILSTLLTAASEKAKVSETYNEKARVYTIAVADDLSNDEKTYMEAVLNPKSGFTENSGSDTANTYANEVKTAYNAWNTYKENGTPTLTAHSDSNYIFNHPTNDDNVIDVTDVNYVDKYFLIDENENTTLEGAFEEILADVTKDAFIPTKDVTGDEQTGILYTDPLGDYMEFKSLDGVLIDGKVVPVTENQDGSYTATIPENEYHPIYGTNIGGQKIYINVTTDNNGNQTVQVQVPSAVLPAQAETIEVDEDGKATISTHQDLPLRVLYTVGLKDSVLSEGGTVGIKDDEDEDNTGVSAAYIAGAGNKSEDGKSIYFYTNQYTNKSGTEYGDATVQFTPSDDNRYYYFQTNRVIYSKITDSSESELSGQQTGTLKTVKDGVETLGNIKVSIPVTNKEDLKDDTFYYLVIDYYRKADQAKTVFDDNGTPSTDANGDTIYEAEHVYTVVSRTGKDLKDSVGLINYDTAGLVTGGEDIDENSPTQVLATTINAPRLGRMSWFVEKKENSQGESTNNTNTADYYYVPTYTGTASNDSMEGDFGGDNMGLGEAFTVYLGNNGRLTAALGEYTVKHEFKSADSSLILPTGVTNQKPNDATQTVETTYTVPTEIKDVSDSTDGNTYVWVFGGWYKDEEMKEEADETVSTDTTLYGKWTRELDNWKDSENGNDEETGGDGIPDKYQVKVVYKAGDGGEIADNAKKLEILTITDEEGQPAASGTVKASGSTATANEGYQFANWSGTKTSVNNENSETLSEVPKQAATDEITLSNVSGGDEYTYTALFETINTDLSVTKERTSIVGEDGTTRTGDNVMAQVGDTITWIITVTNNGNVTMNNITVKDNLDGATLKTPDNSDGYTLNGDGTATISTLSPSSDPVTITATYIVKDTDAGKIIKNSAIATPANGTGTTGTDEDGITVENRSLTVTKAADKTSATAGTTVNYTITVKNTGNVDLYNVAVTDTMTGAKGDLTVDKDKLPTDVTYKDDGTFSIDELKVNGEVKIQVSYTMQSSDSGTITNTAKAEGYVDKDDTDGPPDVTGQSDSVPVTKTTSGSSGGTKYTLTYVTNGGGSIAPTRHSPNTVVQLTKTPLREGYTFTGWYADEGLTQKITEIKMTSNKTVYAGWELTSVPGLLNSDDHYAYIIGYPDGTVRPNGSITRAEVATIFFRLLTDEARQANLTESNQFTDVNPGQWFNIPISTMAKLGILNGRTATTFAPDEPITRAEFAAICARFDTSLDLGTSQFTDLNGHWAKAEIEKAVSLGWIMGYEDNTFRPDNNITRAEAATMINRVLQRIPETPEDLLTNMQTWPDNADTKKWYYLAIQEATNSHDFQRKTELYETWTQLRETPDWTQYEH